MTRFPLRLLSLMSAALASGQEAAVPAPASRLEQLDAIYRQQLRAKHVPLLSKYITELQQQAAKATDPAPWSAEIGRVQAVISAGGTVDLAAASKELAPPRPGPPPPPPAPDADRLRDGKKILSLTPALARSIRPVPPGSAVPENAALGRISWRLDTLEPGTYQVVLHFSLHADTQAETLVRVDFAGQQLEAAIPGPPPGAEGGPRRFRLLRLGQLRLEGRVEGAELTLTAGDPESRSLLLRHLHLSLLPPPTPDGTAR